MIREFDDLNRLSTENLRCEYLLNPSAIDERSPRLGWRSVSKRKGARQTAFQIQVSTTRSKLQEGVADLWDTRKTVSDESQQITYSGQPLYSKMQCYWRVKLWDDRDKESEWSEIASWGMGLLEEDDWNADWIGLDLSAENNDPEYELPPSPYLRKGFEVEKKVKAARVYATSLGLHELWLNGQRIGDRVLAPGWTDYKKRLYYNCYDVTDLLLKGGNALGAILSYGWYSGYIGYAVLVQQPKVKDFYGKGAALLCQLEIEYEDGSTESISSDSSWKATSGPVRQSDILMGEVYDARMGLGNWKYAEYDDSNWVQSQLVRCKPGTLQATPHEPMRVTQELPAVNVHQDPDGKWIFDFGQNFAGVVRLSVIGRSGQKITVRHGEMLHEDGSLMTENLRKARATCVYTCSGNPEGEIWNSRFSYQGFRYAEVSGLKEKPDLELLTGLVIGSDLEAVGSFKTSSPLIDQLYQNIVWTQRANYIDVPTDCPQRDERLGWLGDAQIYVNAATYNTNVAGFFKKWMRDVVDAQWENGAYTNFAPRPFNRPRYKYSPAWMEAGIICPYFMYLNYGDTCILETHYDSFKKFMTFHLQSVGESMVYQKGAFRNVTPSGGWGDWLCLGKETPKHQIANLYFGYALKLMASISEILGKESDYAFYSEKFEQFQTAFVSRFVDDGGVIEGDTQTLYAMAIVMEVLPEAMNARLGSNLMRLVDEAEGRMATGFIGTRFLMPALSAIGRSDVAYKLLCNVDFPSWGYSVVNGATSVWERWNSYSHKTGFFSPEMNSYSHYAFGAVCEWMFGNMAGIRPLSPGYRKVLLQPEVTRLQNLDTVNAQHDTLYGRVESSWKLKGDECKWHVVLPANTRALVRLPCEYRKGLLIDGRFLDEKEGEALGSSEGRFCEFELEAGSYLITFSVKALVWKEPSSSSELVDHEADKLSSI
ncbi:alpha-L-rhamnosidase [Pelagicoccus mobilis]|uniref:alpha-L-rhamnosidase n=1 Tax=Pelagicoccus mobilis TaxID=415221 RepID=A0A934RV59_9BACT|nr:alpha-L-rhamnosidase [Pelagicoccus mobilis]MBK1876015.1 family 78 glycoside hydrolase catalytic domain [Pelagicoccus mobilis]